ncbi:Retrotransposon gag protein [Corchorus olitorius]|uniref:Retrotransposon gag protein n=1 Tax=Corchorus olitorius TaxID=93759 RepID=A0A1R3J5K3_9ROSI|nr:Retrotransposon gag protein [Corchorus olitorius]
MPPKNDTTSLTEAIASLQESMAAQLQDIRISQEKLSLKVDHSIVENQTSIQNLQTKLTQLEASSSSLLPLSTLLGRTSNTSNLNTTTQNTQKFPKPPEIFSIKPPKFHLTTFDGTNPHAWLFQAEQYFAYYSIEPQQRLPIASFFMTGEALCWYQWMFNNGLLSDWDSFAREVELRFGPSFYLNPSAGLFKLKQIGTVTEYQREFEILANRVTGLSDGHLLNCFISGLLPDLQHEIIPLSPPSLTHALALAKVFEAKLNAQKKHTSSTSYAVLWWVF